MFPFFVKSPDKPRRDFISCQLEFDSPPDATLGDEPEDGALGIAESDDVGPVAVVFPPVLLQVPSLFVILEPVQRPSGSTKV